MATFKIKQGDTLSFLANVVNANGEPVINAISKLKSQICTERSVLVAEFTITSTNTVGQYLFKVATDAFPAETTLYTDIQLTDNGIVNSSVTMTIQVVKDVTK